MTVLLQPVPGVEIDAEFDRLVEALTRRGLLSGGLGAATLAGLAGCSADQTAPAPSSSAATRRVDSARGPIMVPARPARVVSTDWFVNNTLYDLGVTPVGVQDPGAQYIAPRYRGAWTKAAKVNTTSIQVEKIAALQPDLIIGTDGAAVPDELYRQLTAVAPTVLAVASPWQDMVRTVAEAMNRVDALQQLENRLADRAVAIKTGYADLLDRFRWDVLQGGFDQGRFYVYGPNSLAGLVLAPAGVRFAEASLAAAKITKPGVGIQSLSYENIDRLRDADAIAYYATYDGKPNNLGPQLFAQQLWKNLPAVKAGRLVPIPDFLVGGYGDALAMLDELEAGLKKIGGTR